jgi:hypothetical protein
VNLRFIDWIWHVRGSLTLSPGQSSDDAFNRLDPLFRQTGTSHQRTNDTLSFSKNNQAAQDRMSVFNGGALRIEKSMAESVLNYHLTSRALLFCFLAPLLFLSIAQFAIAINKFDKPPHEAAKRNAVMPMNPIDKALGAPAPDTPKTDDAGAEEESKKPSPTPAYVFAAIFAALYVVGRILEDRRVKALFRTSLLEASNGRVLRDDQTSSARAVTIEAG